MTPLSRALCHGKETARRLGGVLAASQVTHHGLSLQQLRVFLAVYASAQAARPMQLARDLSLSKSSVSMALTGLETAGLVRRRPCHDHDGHVAIHPTTRGMLLLAALMDQFDAPSPIRQAA